MGTWSSIQQTRNKLNDLIVLYRDYQGCKTHIERHRKRNVPELIHTPGHIIGNENPCKRYLQGHTEP